MSFVCSDRLILFPRLHIYFAWSSVTRQPNERLIGSQLQLISKVNLERFAFYRRHRKFRKGDQTDPNFSGLFGDRFSRNWLELARSPKNLEQRRSSLHVLTLFWAHYRNHASVCKQFWSWIRQDSVSCDPCFVHFNLTMSWWWVHLPGDSLTAFNEQIRILPFTAGEYARFKRSSIHHPLIQSRILKHLGFFVKSISRLWFAVLPGRENCRIGHESRDSLSVV